MQVASRLQWSQNHRSTETGTTRSCPAVFVFWEHSQLQKLYTGAKNENQLLDSFMAGNLSRTRNAMPCDSAGTRTPPIGAWHPTSATAAAVCGHHAVAHASLSALLLFTWLRLYRLLVHTNGIIFTVPCVLTSAAWLAGAGAHAIQPRHALRSR